MPASPKSQPAGTHTTNNIHDTMQEVAGLCFGILALATPEDIRLLRIAATRELFIIHHRFYYGLSPDEFMTAITQKDTETPTNNSSTN